MKSKLKFINSFLFGWLQKTGKNHNQSQENDKREYYTGRRKIDFFRRNIIRYRKLDEIVVQTIKFLKEFLDTEHVGFYCWNEEDGFFIDLDQPLDYKIQIFDPFILTLSEYDIIFLKRNINLIRNQEHKQEILKFLEKKQANVLIPLIMNETILGFLYANTSKRISIAEYFSLEEFRYFVIIALSNSMIYTRLENLLKTLEEKIKERTKELEQAQQTLIQQEKMATLGTMVSGIAHELNTPIGVIRASSGNVFRYFESLIEIFFMGKDFRSLPDEFLTILRYFIYHLAVSSNIVSKKVYKLKKELRDFLITNQINYDEDLIHFLIDFHLYTGNPKTFLNKNNLFSKIVYAYAQFSSKERKFMLDILRYVAMIYENLDRIFHSSISISKLVESLRRYSRTSRNEFLVHNMDRIIENTLKLLENTFKNRITIQKELSFKENIECDANQIEQVLINLLMNAYHALKKQSHPSPLIIIRTIEKNQDEIEIQIQDNGPGIPEEIHHQIWDPFFTTKPQGEGTGLGLGIVKNIIENHNGKVFFRTNPEGTTFFVQLPKKQIEKRITRPHPALKFGRYDWR